MYPSDRDVISECPFAVTLFLNAPSNRDVISECPTDGRIT